MSNTKSQPPPAPRPPYGTMPGPGAREPSTLDQIKHHAAGAHQRALGAEEQAKEASDQAKETRELIVEVRRNELAELLDYARQSTKINEEIAFNAASAARRSGRVVKAFAQLLQRQGGPDSIAPMRAALATGHDWDEGSIRIDVPAAVSDELDQRELEKRRADEKKADDVLRKADERRTAVRMAFLGGGIAFGIWALEHGLPWLFALAGHHGP